MNKKNYHLNIISWLITISAALLRLTIGSASFFYHKCIQPIKQWLIWLAEKRQHLYDKCCLFMLEIPGLRSLLIYYHTTLFYFRYLSELLGDKIKQYISLNTFALIISMVASRLHVIPVMLIFCLIFIRLDFALLSACHFYKKYPLMLSRSFPQIHQPIKRQMWTRVSQIVTEAATNPQVQSVAVAVTGALVWKGIDVYDTLKQEEIATADREANAQQAELTRQAEATQAELSRQAEAIEREKDRETETKRLAFDKLSSPEYHRLSEEQKARIEHAAKTGQISI